MLKIRVHGCAFPRKSRSNSSNVKNYTWQICPVISGYSLKIIGFCLSGLGPPYFLIRVPSVQVEFRIIEDDAERAHAPGQAAAI